MPAMTPKQIAEMKKKLEEVDKKNDAIMAKIAAAQKQAEALKAATKQAKTELSQETD